MLEHAHATQPLIAAEPEEKPDDKVIKMPTLAPEIVEPEAENSAIVLPTPKNVHFRDPIAAYYEHPGNPTDSHADDELPDSFCDPEAPDKDKNLDFNLLSGLLMASGRALCVTALIIMTAKISVPLIAVGVVLIGVGFFSKQSSKAPEKEENLLDNIEHMKNV
ncbi:MAG: hypothetical protein K0U24_02650 [Gammaproteobacteria bacterium]|nr:hypothetical protein [Gammaproteobacteria bacterium]